MSKVAKAIAARTDDSKVIVDFIKAIIFARYDTPCALINNRGTHFCNRSIEALVKKYGGMHKVSMAYHLQINDQTNVSN